MLHSVGRRDAERGEIGTWGRCRGKDEEGKSAETVNKLGVREKSLRGRGDGQMENKVLWGKRVETEPRKWFR